MILSIVHKLLERLIENELLIVHTGTNLLNMAEEIVQEMPKAVFGAHFSSWFSAQLLKHPAVDELFASDEEILVLLRFIQS